MVTTRWVGGSGSWDDPRNWSNGVPESADTAVFATSGSEAVSGSGSTGTLDIAGGSVTLTGSIGASEVRIGPANSTGETLTIAPGATLADPGPLNLPAALGLLDQLVVEGQLEDRSAAVGAGLDFGEAAVTVIGAGAAWKTSGTVNLASSSLLIADGALVTASMITAPSLNTHVVIDTSSTLEAPINADGGFLFFDVVASTVPGAGSTLRLRDPISGSMLIDTQAAQTLDLLGPISNVSTDELHLRGNFALEGPASDNTGTIEGSGQLVLAAAGVAGAGPLLWAGDVVFEPGASTHRDGTSTIFATGSDTISIVNSPVQAYGAANATLTFYNGSAGSTVYGSAGRLTAFGGSGGGIFFGGTNGGNLIVGGSGAATLGGGGNGDQLWANGPMGDLIAAGSGNETLGAGNSTGNNVFFGGTGNDLIAAGAGNDEVVAGPGAATIFGGATGNTAIFAGSGPDLLVLGGGADYVQMGTGNLTVYAGTGGDLFGIYNGLAGGNDVISGFKNGVDQIALRNYASAPDIVSQGGDTTITLSDSTHITLIGVTSLVPGSFV